MSGGHQMDLRQECDWSDPYVIHGGTRRVARRAFMDRTRPNVMRRAFLRRAGLTWAKDPETGEMSPHVVPWQRRSYEAAFGQPPLDWKTVDPANPEQAARWAQWARWKLGFMDAAWKDAQFGVSAVEPAFASVTQSQYGYSAFSDGYYFNVVRSLPITSGHGGYHDFGPGYFNPSMFLEFARAHDLAKPNWYLPTWYGNTTADEFRLEQYLSFQCGLQGMISPPDIDPGGAPEKSPAAQGVVESNHLLQRLGPIFNTMPPTRPPVALLYSLSQFIHAQTLDRKVCYAHETEHGRNVVFTYLAGKLLQQQFMPVLDEDVLDGTLAAEHRAVILTSIDYLDPEVVRALEQFASKGGLVLLTADSTVSIKGAVKLEVAPAWPDAEKIAELKKAGKANEANELMRLRQALAGAKRLADAIRPRLKAAGIEPPLTSSEPGIVVTRHSAGDVEYLFAVNATHDPEGSPMLGLKPVTAELRFPDDGRAVYDAIRGTDRTARWRAFTFGPGQMRVFARTKGIIQGVTLGTPDVRRDYTLSRSPLRLEFAASVATKEGGLLSGSIPLRIVLLDPLGEVRYDLYRATDRGTLNLALPLALNDPPGEWKLSVTEQLSGTTGEKSFVLPAIPFCPAAAGEVRRAVHWPADRERIFRFFRTHQQVVLVAGSSDYNRSAAERLEKILQPWNIRCTTMTAAEASKSRSLTSGRGAHLGRPGLCRARPDQAGRVEPTRAIRVRRARARHPPGHAGSTIRSLSSCLTNASCRTSRTPSLCPARGAVMSRGSVRLSASTRNPLASSPTMRQEWLKPSAHSTKCWLGLNHSRRWPSPGPAWCNPQPSRTPSPELTVAWELALDDRITGLRAAEGKISALTAARTLAEVRPDGGASASPLSPDRYTELAKQFKPANADALAQARKLAPAGCLPKLVGDNRTNRAVVYWGGRLELFDQAGKLLASRQGPQDLTAMTWAGPYLVTGDADGRLTALAVPARTPYDQHQ